MSDRKKSVLELLIFGVILIAILLYYGVNRGDRENNSDTNNGPIQTVVPTVLAATQQPVNTTDIPDDNESKQMPDAAADGQDIISAKSDEYHNETEEGVQ